jgi:hypothetical protein
VAAACDKGPARLHLVPSPLLWHGVSELLAAMGPGSALLCVEAEPDLAALARERMPPSLAGDSRLAFIEASTPGEALDAARELGSFRACSLCALSGGFSLDKRRYEEMAAALQSEFEADWRNRAALMILGPRWARNILDNLAGLPSMGLEPLPSFPGPVLVCGAGASLEEALPLARSRRDRIGIVACDTALGTLRAAGLEPDLAVCLEGQAHNLADFTCLGSMRVRLAADLSSHPATFRAVAGRKHLTLARITRSPFLDRVEAVLKDAKVPFLGLPPLGSVGVHAACIARVLGRGPVLAAGLDFSFLPGKTHARGCPSLFAEERALARLRRWPGQLAASYRDRNLRLEGGLLTDPILLSYAAVLAESCPGLLDLRAFGPSIGGRRISLAQAEALIDQAKPQESAASGAGGEGSAAIPSWEKLDAFLRAELARLEALRLSMHGTHLLEAGEFRALVLGSDYLWWGFPDQDRVRDLPQDFLNRLVPQVEYWSARLSALLEDSG